MKILLKGQYLKERLIFSMRNERVLSMFALGTRCIICFMYNVISYLSVKGLMPQQTWRVLLYIVMIFYTFNIAIMPSIFISLHVPYKNIKTHPVSTKFLITIFMLFTSSISESSLMMIVVVLYPLHNACSTQYLYIQLYVGNSTHL